ncbi:MAG: alkaline phosphatase family protein [Bifidobacteriaceae bacterium]|jgi:hypothetical protein|nr:alkaline phosphatase family protein [Bifidobacteriaceae bacterium]
MPPAPAALEQAAPAWVTPPDYAAAGLASVFPRALARLGIDLPNAHAPRPDEAAGWDRPRGIVVVLADGLGLANLAERRGHAPQLADLPRERLLSGFPSTTVASLASLGTGLAPGRTALAGYSLRDPATGLRANLIQWDTPTEPRRWQPHPTIFERLAAIGRPAGFVGEARFAQSPMTQSSLRGASFHPATKKPASLVAATVAAARAGDGLIYTYWGQLDKVGHARGWRSRQWAEALEALDGAMRRLSAELPRRWELWLTADHGMIDVTDAPVWDLAEAADLREGVDVVAGEARAAHLYTADPPAVAARWRERLGAEAWVLTKAEAIAAGLFGQVEARVEPYLGDVIVAMAGRGIVLDSRTEGGAAKMVGHHGSLTAAEMEVPLIRWPAG